MSLDLCFEDAAIKRQKKEISEEDYLRCITAHFGGTRHGQDKKCGFDEKFEDFFTDPLDKIDPFSSRMRAWILSRSKSSAWLLGIEVVQDTRPLYDAFHAYRVNDAEALKAGLDDVDKIYGTERPDMRRTLCSILASTALAEKKADMLRVMLQEDHPYPWLRYHSYFNKIYDDYLRSGSAPELLKIADEAGYESHLHPGMTWRDFRQLDMMF